MSESLNKTKKIAFCGIIAALSVVVMLGSYFPYLTYAIPAVAGVFTVLVVAQIGVKWAWVTYAVASVLGLLCAEKESAVTYVCFFGFYPIIKYLLEKINKPTVEYILKFLVFNLALVAIYFVSIFVLGVSAEEFTSGFRYALVVLALAANVTFFIYDIALNRVIGLYYNKYHNKFKNFLR